MKNPNNQRLIIEIDKSVTFDEAIEAVKAVMLKGQISRGWRQDKVIPCYCWHTFFKESNIHVEVNDKRTLKSADSFYVYKEGE
jgi:hypothetical protein